MQTVIVWCIRIYQKLLSPEKNFLVQLGIRKPRHTCFFYPSCSDYTIQAVYKYGSVSGLWRGVKRISRCRPGATPGIDMP